MDKFEKAICEHNPLYKEGLQDKYYQGAKWAWQSRQAEVDDLTKKNKEAYSREIKEFEKNLILKAELEEKDKKLKAVELILIELKESMTNFKELDLYDKGVRVATTYTIDDLEKALRGEHES
ncbi:MULTISPECIES: hypothetical protein [Acinetobacter]|uniref:hypothetical protein n=1 Tax=Acinetobacter TaxID=469 RepID=UPI0002AEBBDF|nr:MULTISPECIES: hypothetical protein [Acinetobacter]ELW90976.1 hypothetical protein ACINWC743_1793 [Acinetobacter sp. WC-743]